MVAQATCVDAGRHEVVAERVHQHLRRHSGLVTEVVAVLAGGERRAGLRLDRDEARVALPVELALVVRERESGEVRPAADAGDDHIGLGLCHLHLQDGLLADDRLVQADVVEHAAEAVVAVIAHSSIFDRL
jgi:hypothetical protein